MKLNSSAHPHRKTALDRGQPNNRSLLVIALIMLAALSGGSTPYFSDQFNYTAGGTLGSAGSSGGWQNSNSGVNVTAGSLDGTALGLLASAANKVTTTSSSSSGTYNQFNSGIISGTVYYSFLLRVNSTAGLSAGGQSIAGLVRNGSQSSYYVDVYLGLNGSTIQVGLSKLRGTATWAATPLVAGTTCFIVASYTFVSGSGNDVVSLWVNPTSLGGSEPTTDVTFATGGDGNNSTGIGRCYIYGGLAADVDEVRIASTWAEVTPPGGPVVGQQLGFTTQPVNSAPGATMSPVVVQIQTSGGGAVASNAVPVTLTLTSGSGTLSGTTTRNTDATGKAAFNDLSIDLAGAGKQLTAAASGIGAGLASALSTNFSIVAPLPASKLVFATQPANAQVGATMSPVVVQVQDPNGTAIPSNAVPITLTLSSGSGVLSGTTTQNTDTSGKATFGNLSINATGTSDQFTAAASGIGAGLASALSSTFAITPASSGSNVVITSARMLSAGFVVNGFDNYPDTNSFCQCLGSPDVTLSADQWTLVNYGNEDASGFITFTNPVAPAAVLPNVFYRLRIGNPATKENGPTILVGPASQTVTSGSTVTFSANCTGPLVHFLWYKNGAPIPNTDSASLVINNAQTADAGTYYLVAANPVGTVTSASATLRVGNFAPTISSQPQDQTVNAGGSAIFALLADGTQPLGYQWYFNTNTPVTDGANIAGSLTPTLTLNNIPSNNVVGGAGTYSCTVSNALSQLSSRAALLTVNPVPTAPPNTNMLGFAELAGVTGGAGGPVVYATNYPSLSNYCKAAGPLIILITNQITGPGPNVDQYCYVDNYKGLNGGNKTIRGVGTNAQLNAIDLRLNATNIVIQNLLFQVTPGGTNDGITIDGASSGTGQYIWIDHCTISNAQDGSIDVTKGADYVTVSWCKFIYAPKVAGSTHEYVHLVGSSDSDTKGHSDGHFHVTFHHNWYSDNAVERMPSLRFSYGHVFNCYYTCAGNNYCVRTRINSQTLVENCYYLGVQNPWEMLHTSGTDGLLRASGCITNNCTLNSSYYPGVVLIPGTDALPWWDPPSGMSRTPPYSDYTNALQQASDVPYYVQTYAGHGKYPYVP